MLEQFLIFSMSALTFYLSALAFYLSALAFYLSALAFYLSAWLFCELFSLSIYLSILYKERDR